MAPNPNAITLRPAGNGIEAPDAIAPQPGYNGSMAEETEKGRWVFYYDGECGFCTASVRFLARLDFFCKLTWMPFQDLPGPPAGLSWEDLDRAAYLETRNSYYWGVERRLYRGFYAFRMLSLRLPPLMPLTPLLWLPGVNRLGEVAYSWVARNRYRISRRCRLKPGK